MYIYIYMYLYIYISGNTVKDMRELSAVRRSWTVRGFTITVIQVKMFFIYYSHLCMAQHVL